MPEKKKKARPRKPRVETHPPRLQDLLSAEEALLRARLSAARAALASHSGEMGASLENEARAFLRTFLPPEYGLGRGFVVWRAPGPQRADSMQFDDEYLNVEVSTQLDIIIYDALRGGPIADLGTSAVYPLEHVYGYVEVKAVLRDELENSLRVSKRLRSTNVGFYRGRPTAFRSRMPEALSEILAAQLSDPNAAVDVQMPRPRLTCWFLAFENGRRPSKAARDTQGAFDRAWKRTGHFAHFHGILIVDLKAGDRPTGGAAFLRCIPDQSRQHEFRSEMVLDAAIGRFKSQMLTDLVLFDRPPPDVAVLYDGYWVKSAPERP